MHGHLVQQVIGTPTTLACMIPILLLEAIHMQSGAPAFRTGRREVMRRGVASLSWPTSLAQVSAQQQEKYPRNAHMSAVHSRAVVLASGRSANPADVAAAPSANIAGIAPLHATCRHARFALQHADHP